MPRCAHCGSPDLAAGFDQWNCNICGKQTVMATGRAPLEGQHFNDDLLDAACRDWVAEHHPAVLRHLADTIAGQPDAGTQVGGAPLTDIDPNEPAEEPLAEEPTEDAETTEEATEATEEAPA